MIVSFVLYLFFLNQSNSLHETTVKYKTNAFHFQNDLSGFTVLLAFQNVPVGPNNRPKLPVVISQCGEM